MLLDYAPFRLLVNLIRGARAVLFPSLYEGFGLPALEAMLLGTPVVTSNTASMPEVVGDAAITVDPYDVAALVRAIQAVDGDAELRARLAEAGSAPVLLVDDLADSRWTMTVAGRELRRAGVAAVLPFVLALTA